MMLRWWWVLCWGDGDHDMEYDENQIDDDGYEQDDNADDLKMIVLLLMSWRWWCWLCGHDDCDGVASYHTSNMLS